MTISARNGSPGHFERALDGTGRDGTGRSRVDAAVAIQIVGRREAPDGVRRDAVELQMAQSVGKGPSRHEAVAKQVAQLVNGVIGRIALRVGCNRRRRQ